MTPSLTSFFYSVFWGTIIVILPITMALVWISQADKLKRNF
nr:photosystem II protein X [Cyanidiaceae sp.]